MCIFMVIFISKKRNLSFAHLTAVDSGQYFDILAREVGKRYETTFPKPLAGCPFSASSLFWWRNTHSCAILRYLRYGQSMESSSHANGIILMTKEAIANVKKIFSWNGCSVADKYSVDCHDCEAIVVCSKIRSFAADASYQHKGLCSQLALVR